MGSSCEVELLSCSYPDCGGNSPRVDADVIAWRGPGRE